MPVAETSAGQWPDQALLDLLNIDLPVLQAPMAGANGSAMAIAVSKAGGLGALPCAMLSSEQVVTEVETIRQATDQPFNLNFFCHAQAEEDPDSQASWIARLTPYFDELGVDHPEIRDAAGRKPFDDEMCALVETLRPPVVSFHFGLPEPRLLTRVKATGCVVLSSATSVAEAKWLEANGADAIIAQGYEAGGHRGMFLSDDLSTQVGTMALVPQIVDAVDLPVIAAGGISDSRGVAAAIALGASATQIGTAYLFTPEALISDLHRAELRQAPEDRTALTNVFSGRPARSLINRLMLEVGPISDTAPAFPTAGNALASLKAKSETAGKSDFSSLWSGQAASLATEMGAFDLTQSLARNAKKRLKVIATEFERH